MRATTALRIGIFTDGLRERLVDGRVEIANGGIGTYIYQLVKHLQGVDTPHEFYLIRGGVGRLDIYQGPRTASVFLPQTASVMLARAADLAHRRLVREHRLDLLHYPNQFGGTFLPRQLKRVTTLHDLTPLLFPQHHPWQRVLAYRLLLRRSLRGASHVIVDSAHTRTDLLKGGLVGDDQVTVIPLGAADSFHPGARRADFAGRYALPDRFILTVGVLEPRKNHALLVRALAELHAAGERIDLVIVGREGWGWRDPLADATVQHLRPWVHILRNVSDVDLPELYARATVVAYPSLYEGFGLPLVEAMASGTPVVAARTSSLVEVAGTAALLADPTDAGDFAAQLLALLRDPALRDRLVGAGLRRARELSWRRTAEQTLAVYEKVCSLR